MLRSLLMTLCFLPSMIFGKVIITTVAFNQPIFIELQDKCFKAFLEDDYEFIVFSDAQTPEMEQRLRETCERQQLQFIPLPSDIHEKPYMYREPWEDKNHPCVRCSNGVQYAYDQLGLHHDDIFVTIDSDIFMIRPASIRKMIEGYDVGATTSGFKSSDGRKIISMWIGFIFLDMKRLEDKETFSVNCGMIDGIHVDAGGYTSQYVKAHPNLKWKVLYGPYVKDLEQWNSPDLYEDFKPLIGKDHCMQLLGENCFLHFHEGTNWSLRSNEYYRSKLDPLVSIIDSMINKWGKHD